MPRMPSSGSLPGGGSWGSYSEKGTQNYLLVLSIYQTCRLKGVSFLRFLRSGLLDLDAFFDEFGR